MELNSNIYISCKRCNRPINSSFFGHFDLFTSNCYHPSCYFKQRLTGEKLDFYFYVKKNQEDYYLNLARNDRFVKYCLKIARKIGYVNIIDFTEIPRIQEFIHDRDSVALYPEVELQHVLKLNKRLQDWSEQVLYNCLLAPLNWNNFSLELPPDEIYQINLKIWMHLNDQISPIAFEQKHEFFSNLEKPAVEKNLKNTLLNIKKFQKFVFVRMMFNPSKTFLKLLELLPHVQDSFYHHCINYAEALFKYLWKFSSCDLNYKFLKYRTLSNFPARHPSTFSFYQRYTDLLRDSALSVLLENNKYMDFNSKKQSKKFIKGMDPDQFKYYQDLIKNHIESSIDKLEFKAHNKDFYKIKYHLLKRFGPMETSKKCRSNWLSDYAKRIKMSQRLSKDPCCICLEDKGNPLFFSNCPHSICNSCIRLITKEKKQIDCPECRAISNSYFQRGIKK